MDETLLELMEKMPWTLLTRLLKKNRDNNKHGYWTDGAEILCKTEGAADHLANFLEDIGFDYVNTGYYDPEEDEASGETDDHTGYWYVSID